MRGNGERWRFIRRDLRLGVLVDGHLRWPVEVVILGWSWW